LSFVKQISSYNNERYLPFKIRFRNVERCILSKFRCRTNLMHFLLPICGKFTRALLAHQICKPKMGLRTAPDSRRNPKTSNFEHDGALSIRKHPQILVLSICHDPIKVQKDLKKAFHSSFIVSSLFLSSEINVFSFFCIYVFLIFLFMPSFIQFLYIFLSSIYSTCLSS
jgi:hypothetical protein